MPRELIFDYETRSQADIKEVGLDRYSKDPSTQILMCAYAFGDGKVHLWEAHKGKLPSDLEDAFRNPEVIKVAWNAAFERELTFQNLGIWIPFEQWRDPMILAHSLSLPGSLDSATTIMRMEERKDERGEDLIKTFSMPVRTEGLFGIEFRDWDSHPEEWQKFCAYCVQDVRAERAFWRRCINALPESEWKGWFFDQKMNRFGIPTNLKMVQNAMQLATRSHEDLQNELKTATGLENPNSDAQMKEWVKARGYPWQSLRKEYVQMELDNPNSSITAECRKILKVRQEASKRSYKKLSRLLQVVGEDGYIRYQFRFGAAARTMRWAGADVQLQNIARPNKQVKKNPQRAIDLILANDYETIKKEYPSVIGMVTSSMRMVFQAPPGHKMVISDFNAIENRGLGYLARCNAILDVFRQGRDPYLAFGEKMYGRSYEDLDAEYKSGNEKPRQDAKPAVLGCFGKNTPIMTQWGLKRIADIVSQDLVFDGENWVSHDGVADQGVKKTTTWAGVEVTPDHRVMSLNEWRTIWDISQNFQLEKSAIDLATGKLLNMKHAEGQTESGDPSIVANACAKESNTSTKTTWNEEKLGHALNARIAEFWKKKVQSTPTLKKLIEKWWIDWQTDTTQFYLDVEDVETLLIAIMVEELPASSLRSTLLLHMLSHYQAHRMRIWNLIGSITTEIMPLEIYALPRENKIIVTKKTFAGLLFKVRRIVQQSLGKNLPPSTETLAQYVEKFVQESPLNKLFPINLNAEVPTWDILNSGPYHRFIIWTLSGPALVHNCGYGLSGGEEIINEYGDKVRSGLWGYAKALGVDITRDFAHDSVRIFRESYPEVVQFWYDLEDAFKSALKGTPKTVGYLKFDRRKLHDGTYMVRIHLPSGRCLHYLRARIEEENFTYKDKYTGEERTRTREVIYYEGIEHSATQDSSGARQRKSTKWTTRAKTYGGKLAENCTQAFCRDLLLHSMLLADELGFTVCGVFHDEGLAIVSDDVFSLGIADFKWAMSQSPVWASDFPLAAEGFESQYYKK